MSAIKAIKFYAQFAWIIVKTLAWMPGAVIRNAIQKARKRRRGEKEKWVLGYDVPDGVVIGLIATRWDNAPTVAIATACFEMKIDVIQRGTGSDASPQVIGSVIAEALRANLHIDDLGQFSCYMACFLGNDAYFIEGFAERQDGFLINLKLKDNKLRLRVSHRGSPYDVLAAIHRVDNIRGDYGHDRIPQELMFWFELSPDESIASPDEDVVGKVGVHEGFAAQGGRPITLTREGWRETSEFKARPGEFPPPRVPKVTRHPASILD